MASLKTWVIKHNTLLICLTILITATGLRLPNLGYSDYHGDELKAVMVPKNLDGLWSFLLDQRKGPMQFLISYIPYTITHNYKNEVAQRLPFAIASSFSAVLLFLFVNNLTSSKLAGFCASFIFLTHGFIVGFGRIAQYQNLNLLFSFGALVMYSMLRKPCLTRKKQYFYSLAGTALWCFSILSHWDAVLILPIVLFLTFKVLLTNIKVLFLNVILGLMLLSPFLLPYLTALSADSRNQTYLFARVGLDLGYSKIPLYKALIELYNPYIVLPFLLITATVSLIGVRKYYPIVIWFIAVFGLFELMVKNPGTHIYNFLLPIFVLSGIGIGYLLKVHKHARYIILPALAIVFSFMYYQAYIIYVDSNKEYPYESKTIELFGLNLNAQKISDIKPDYMRGSYIPLFGFPHARYWNEINDFINTQNIQNNEQLKFITNEDQAFCDGYMDTQYGTGQVYYAIGIKRPSNFVMDYSFSNIGSKKLVKTFKLRDETVVKIYKVQAKQVT